MTCSTKKPIRFLVSCAAMTIGAGVASAGIGDEVFKLLPDDGDANDVFGSRVAIDGNTALSAAQWDNDNGDDSGSVYVFDVATGTQAHKLTLGDGVTADWFGQSIGLSDSIAIIGSLGDRGYSNFNRRVHLFNTDTGLLAHTLVDTTLSSSQYTTQDVAISGDRAIIGVKHSPANGSSPPRSGSADLYDTATGLHVLSLVPTDGIVSNGFGSEVAINSTVALVSADIDSTNGTNAGAVYVFDLATGQQLFKLFASDGASGDVFGNLGSISETHAIIGAQNNDDACPSNTNCNSGAAYIFDLATGQELHKLVPTDGAEGDRFGISVGLSGNIAIVGANGDDDGGSAYLFDVSTGQELDKVLSTDIQAGDNFGVSVGISGQRAIVGASRKSDFGTSSGAAYLFDTTAPCPTDINGDGVTDTADLGILVAQFGSSGPSADLNSDGSVDTADLGILIGAFGGDCP